MAILPIYVIFPRVFVILSLLENENYHFLWFSNFISKDYLSRFMLLHFYEKFEKVIFIAKQSI